MYRKYYILTSISLILYIIQIWIKHFSSIQGFFRDYFADLLALPLILTFGLVAVRKVKKLPFFYLNKSMIIFSVIYTSVLFEYILPKYHTKFTGDIYDVFYYLIGALIYYLIQEQLKKDEYNQTSNLYT